MVNQEREPTQKKEKTRTSSPFRSAVPDSSCFKTITSSSSLPPQVPLSHLGVFHCREGKKCGSNLLCSMISSPSLSSQGTPGKQLEQGRWGREGSQRSFHGLGCRLVLPPDLPGRERWGSLGREGGEQEGIIYPSPNSPPELETWERSMRPPSPPRPPLPTPPPSPPPPSSHATDFTSLTLSPMIHHEYSLPECKRHHFSPDFATTA